MLNLLRYILIFWSLGISFLGFAQNPVFEHMEDVSNLPDVEFYDIAQDNQNYMWLAADKGLYRYDGNDYKLFVHPEQKSNSLFQLKFDTHNKLWCNNIYGQLFYVENDSLKLFYDASKLVKGQLAHFEINQKYIQLFTVTGMYTIDLATKEVNKFFDEMCISNATNNETNYTFTVSYEDILQHHRIYKLNNSKSTKIFEITSEKEIESPKLFAFNTTVFFTHKGVNTNVLYSINKVNNDVTKLKTPAQIQHETIYNLLSFEGNYWFLTNSGVFIYDFKNNQFIFKEQLFSTESITDVQKDFNNNYWYTTLDSGVFVSPNLNIRRVKLNSNSNKITASCALPNNQFVLGTNKGKLLFYDQYKSYKQLQLPGQKIIGNLFYDKISQQLIVSINASESFVVNLKNNQIVDANNTFAVAKSFSKIDRNTLFYGNYKEGIIYKNPFTNPKKKLIRSSRVKVSIVNNNQLLVAYIDGLFTYNLKPFSFEEITFNNTSLLVNAIAKTKNRIWLATQHDGLLTLENNELVKSSIPLPENSQINTIKSDTYFLWISTDSGLFQYNTKTKTLRSLTKQDGLSEAINKFLILQDKIIITQPNSFYVLPKDHGLFKAYKTAKIKIETIRINGRDTLVQSNYNLPYNLNKIGLKFNSNGFQTNQNVRYHYRVKQLDTSWQNIPLNTHSVNFNSLSSGTYTFELKAQNVSTKNPVFATPTTFVITKPFWETYWFSGLVILTIFGLVWLYFRWLLQQKEQQRIVEIDKILLDKKITNLKLENLRSQMNPHFIFNALNSIQDYIISNEKELASSYLVKFSRLIRMYLDYSQQNEITLQEELSALKLYLELEKVRFEDELEYHIMIDNRLNTKQIKVPSLFIQLYVENALKHGLLHKLNDRKLYIDAKIIQQNKLQITVEDNGIGREQSEKLKRAHQQHKPFATKANKERVHLYKNKLKRDIAIATFDLYDENEAASGTKVVITLPIL